MTHHPVDDLSGHCQVCGRRCRDYGGHLEHVRGRGAFVGMVIPADRLERKLWARDKTTDECIAAGICECGQWLDEHDPWPPRRKRRYLPSRDHAFRRSIDR